MNFEKMEEHAGELLGFCQRSKNIILYGTGIWGNQFLKYFSEKGINVSAFTVSDGHVHSSDLNSIPIYDISNLPFQKKDCAIILTLNLKFHEEIKTNLINLGYENIYCISMLDVINCTNQSIKTFLKTNSIDISKEVLDLIKFKMPNPFLFSEEVAISFLLEFPELIMPIMGNKSLLAEGPYEYSGVVMDSSDVVLDCGANIGIFSAYAASQGCKVYAFEPTPATIKFLDETKKIYSGSITIVPLALSNQRDTVKFYISTSSVANSLNDGVGSTEYIEVNTITIDEFVAENNIDKVDFIKADIEGAERLMLQGAKNTLKNFAPKLAICTYHLPDDKEVLEKIIKDANPNYIIEHKWKKLFAYVK